jgi:hypothetical protein
MASQDEGLRKRPVASAAANESSKEKLVKDTDTKKDESVKKDAVDEPKDHGLKVITKVWRV